MIRVPKDEITVTITGAVGIGKSAIAKLIADALTKNNVFLRIPEKDLHVELEHMTKDDLKSRLKELDVQVILVEKTKR